MITQASGGNADLAAAEIAQWHQELAAVVDQSNNPTTPNSTPWYVWAALLAGAGALAYSLPLE